MIKSDVASEDAAGDLAQARAWWRRGCWIALGLAPGLALMASAWLWPFITLDGKNAGFAWSELWSPRSLVLMSAVIVIPLSCWAGVVLSQRLSFWHVELMAAALGLLMVLIANLVIMQPRVESALWLATLSRLRPADYLLREPLLMQLELTALERNGPRSPGFTVIGSSQVLHGLDTLELSRLVHRPVHRRALAGMFSLEACAVSDRLMAPRAKTAIFYLSPFDVAARKGILNDWKRMLVTPGSWRELVQVLGPSLGWENARALGELWWAARCRLWSVRDATRQILFHLAGPEAGTTPAVLPDTGGMAKADKHAIDPVWVEASYRAMERVFKQFSQGGFEIVVFEGQINPAFREWASDEFWATNTDRIRETVRQAGGTYVSLAEYHPDIDASLWRDHTHVNSEGRRRLTQAVGDYFLRRDADGTK